MRSGHNEEPEDGHAPPEGGAAVWDARLDASAPRTPTAVLAIVGPDGFPFAVRVPVRADPDAGVVRVEADPVGAPIDPGLAVPVRPRPGRAPASTSAATSSRTPAAGSCAHRVVGGSDSRLRDLMRQRA